MASYLVNVMNADVFDMMAAKLSAARDAHLADLNRALFASGAERQPVRRLTWRDRLHVRWMRVSRYIVILWRAVKGDDPYDVESDW